MKISFDKSAPSGKQYSIHLDGQSLTGLAQLDVLSVGRRQGLPLNKVRDMIAEARIAQR